jgi:hypothetical protein
VAGEAGAQTGEEFVPKQNRSWFALVTFCALTALLTALGLAMLFASTTLAWTMAQSLRPSVSKPAMADPTSKTFAGVITDSICGARHASDSGKSPAECARACVRKGSNYMLVDGNKIYRLDGSGPEIDKLAGQRVSVAGTSDGRIIIVSSLSAQ